MKESDYIAITNLAKLRVVEHVLREVLPGFDGAVDDEGLKAVRRTIAGWRAKLERFVDGKVVADKS